MAKFYLELCGCKQLGIVEIALKMQNPALGKH